jgi:hypothetical protein
MNHRGTETRLVDWGRSGEGSVGGATLDWEAVEGFEGGAFRDGRTAAKTEVSSSLDFDVVLGNLDELQWLVLIARKLNTEEPAAIHSDQTAVFDNAGTPDGAADGVIDIDIQLFSQSRA